MRRRFSPTLVDLLRSTLLRMQREVDVDPEDNAAQNLQRSVLRTIAEVQLRHPDHTEDEAA